jgi:hypothetical protein
MTRYYLFKEEEKLRSAIGRKEANKYREKIINGFFCNLSYINQLKFISNLFIVIKLII